VLIPVLALLAAPASEGIETALRTQMAEKAAPGAAYAVLLDGRIAIARGLGTEASDRFEPVTADTAFMIGSVTKTLTAAALLRADDAGILDLDAPVGRVIEGLDAAVAPLTPRSLLTQTSGLGDLPGGMGTSGEDALLRFARSLGPRQFVAPPGAAFSYSNPGLALAGAALEAARKAPYADAMRSLLFAPLGMARTTLRESEASSRPRARGHDAEGRPVPEDDRDTRMTPSGYAYSTASDLAAFTLEWLRAYEGGGRVLSRRAARLMAKPASDFPPTFDGTGYGLGLFVEDRRDVRVLHHGGLMNGYSAQIVLVPDRRLGLVLLMNGDGVVFTPVIDVALETLAGLHPVATAPDPGVGDPVPEKEAIRLAGRYLNRWPLELFREEGALRLRWGGAVREVRRLARARYVARGASGPAIELRAGRAADGTPFLRQFLWAFGRDFEPARDVPPSAEPPAGATAGR
jgi:CubicO group peptidase (beta-lactamase class C family)